MNPQDSPEKYISIEYNDWINKYKPLEEENQRLKSELEESKIKVRIDLTSLYYKRDIESKYVGYLSLNVNKGCEVKIENWKEIEAAISRTITEQFNTPPFRGYLTYLDILHNVKQDEILYEKICEERNKIKSIPKLIRWVFGIKLNPQ